MKLRIKFAKNGVMQYVGHLDLMRYFQKAIVRAKLPAAYSAGFNPHQIISFSAPLGLGLTSEAEYFDLELTKEVDVNEVTRSLNEQMVDGMEVISAHKLNDNSKPSMSFVAACDYIITPKDEKLDLSLFKNWGLKSEYLMVKKTKKSENTIDIKPLIYSFEVCGDCIKTKVASGSASNLKPVEMMNVLANEFMPGITGDRFLYHRTEIYAKDKGGNFIPLSDYSGD